MGINNLQIPLEQRKNCQAILEVLNCNLLWIINPTYSSLNIFSTDQHALTYYINKKYYIYDPNASIKSYDNNNGLSYNLSLGSDCESFHKSGLLYDLNKMFNIEEFASIEHKIGSEAYCYRFFSINNRFMFINLLLTHMPLIKRFINSMLKLNQNDIYQEVSNYI